MTIVLQHQFWDLDVDGRRLRGRAVIRRRPGAAGRALRRDQRFFRSIVQFGLQFEEHGDGVSRRGGTQGRQTRLPPTIAPASGRRQNIAPPGRPKSPIPAPANPAPADRRRLGKTTSSEPLCGGRRPKPRLAPRSYGWTASARSRRLRDRLKESRSALSTRVRKVPDLDNSSRLGVEHGHAQRKLTYPSTRTEATVLVPSRCLPTDLGSADQRSCRIFASAKSGCRSRSFAPGPHQKRGSRCQPSPRSLDKSARRPSCGRRVK